MSQVNLLTIEDSTVKALMIDPRVMAILPCLAGPKGQLESVAPGGTACARCQADKQQLASDAMRTAKSCLISARGERLNQLKAVLNARQLRVHIRNPTGGKTVYTL